MTKTYLHIKNMCCDRCIEVVRNLLISGGYDPVSVIIGEVTLKGSLAQIKSDQELHAYDQFQKMYKINWIVRNNMD